MECGVLPLQLLDAIVSPVPPHDRRKLAMP
jgi:hypothetical protein